jgi:RNA recognition motif-containing protein
LLQVRYARTKDERDAVNRQTPFPTSASPYRRPSFGNGLNGLPSSIATPPSTSQNTLPYGQASFQPQLAGNALLHSLMQQQHQDQLRVLQQQQQQQQQSSNATAFSSQQSLELMRLMGQALQSQTPPPQQSQQSQQQQSAPSDFYNYSAQSAAAASVVAARNNAAAYGGSPSRYPSSPQVTPALTASGMSTETRGPEGCNLFVYNIPEYFTEDQMQALFHHYGSLLSVKVQRDATGHSKCFGFVSYTEPGAADLAISHIDGLIIGGKKLSVRMKTNAQDSLWQRQQQRAREQQQQQQQLQQSRSIKTNEQLSPLHYSQQYSPLQQSQQQHISDQRIHPSPAYSPHSTSMDRSLASSFGGMSLSSAPTSVNTLPSPVLSSAAFFNSNVASQPAHQSPTFDAVMQQALMLQMQTQQQQQQSQQSTQQQQQQQSHQSFNHSSPPRGMQPHQLQNFSTLSQP